MSEASETTKALTKVESDNLSQLVARILSQLAVSAWLPSAALVLSVAFLVHVGAALRGAEEASVGDGPAGPDTSASKILTTALSDLGRTSIGGAVIMIALIVVLTMLTQAFTFESIRWLEGYWGTSLIADDWARRRCAHHGAIRAVLEEELNTLTHAAWREARAELVRMRRREPDITLKFLRVLEARVRALPRPSTQLNDNQRDMIDNFRLRDFASHETIRRRTNVLQRLADYPEAHRVMPTRLGNILRRYEDATGSGAVETLVDDAFDNLPGSVQIAHDEQRGRIDLYCSMTVVSLILSIVAVAAIGIGHVTWTVVSAASCLIAAGLAYRAAVASARYYGRLLLTISTHAR